MTDNILAKLAASFPPDAVSWRVGSTTGDKSKGMALAYIDARDVQDRLDQVCGIYWQVRTPWSSSGKLACEIGIKVGDEWIWRGDGAGDTDVEAEKGAFSDAFKRAAVRFGIGRYLYDIESPWVKLKPAGRSFAIDDSELPKLRAVLQRQAPAVAKVEKPVANNGPAKPADDGIKAEAEKVVKRLKDAKDVFILDQVMDEHRDTVKVLPAATQTYISDLFNKRRRAMMEAV